MLLLTIFWNIMDGLYIDFVISSLHLQNAEYIFSFKYLNIKSFSKLQKHLLITKCFHSFLRTRAT